MRKKIEEDFLFEKDNCDFLKSKVDFDFEENLESLVFKNEEGFKFFNFVKRYGNVCVGMLKVGEDLDFFEKSGLFFYRVKFEPFENFVKFSLKKD